MEAEEDKVKGYKEAIHLLNTKLKQQKEKVSQLEGRARRVEELMKENSNLRTELNALREHVDKVKDEAIAEFQTSQAYIDEIGIQYGNDFEDFHKQAILLFPGMDFSQVQINTLIPMTPVGGDVLDEEEADLPKWEAIGPKDLSR